MLTVFLILLLVGGSLVALLWVGTFFLQDMLYTEPTRELQWQAPAAAGVLTAFLALWCIADYAAQATPTDIPYDTLFRFSPEVSMFDRPAKELWAIKKSGKPMLYVREQLGQTRYRYRDTSYDRRLWTSAGVEAIELETPDKQKLRFNRQEAEMRGGYRAFVSDDGWVMRDYDGAGATDGPTGMPYQFRLSLFLANLFFNFGFLAAWFLSLWLLLRFQYLHALGLAIVMWAIFTLVLMPMILAQVAYARQVYAAA